MDSRRLYYSTKIELGNENICARSCFRKYAALLVVTDYWFVFLQLIMISREEKSKRSISLSQPCGPRLSSKTRGWPPLLWISHCSVSTCAAQWVVWSFCCCVLHSPHENRKHNSGNMKNWSTGHLFLSSTQFSNLTMFFACFCLNELSEFS